MNILQLTKQDANIFIFLQRSTRGVLSKLYQAPGVLLNLLNDVLFLVLEVVQDRVHEDKLGLYTGLGIVELGRLLLNGVSNWWLIFKNFINDSACPCDIGVISLYLNSSIGHFVDRLVHNYRSMRFFHDFVDLVATCTNEQRNHPLGHKNNDGKRLTLDFFEHLVDVWKHETATLILAIHFLIINLVNANVLEYYGHLNQVCSARDWTWRSLHLHPLWYSQTIPPRSPTPW